MKKPIRIILIEFYGGRKEVDQAIEIIKSMSKIKVTEMHRNIGYQLGNLETKITYRRKYK